MSAACFAQTALQSRVVPPEPPSLEEQPNNDVIATAHTSIVFIIGAPLQRLARPPTREPGFGKIAELSFSFAHSSPSNPPAVLVALGVCPTYLAISGGRKPVR